MIVDKEIIKLKKKVTLHYPNNHIDIKVKSTFQANKIIKKLLTKESNTKTVDYEISKTNKCAISLTGITSVVLLEDEAFKEPHFNLKLSFEDSSIIEVPIWGEKRARNSYYYFKEFMEKEPDNGFHRIWQTDKRGVTYIKLSSKLQNIQLQETAPVRLEKINEQSTSI